MNQSEHAKCQAAAKLYRQQREKIARLEARIKELEKRVAQIEQEDAEVIVLVNQHRKRCRCEK